MFSGAYTKKADAMKKERERKGSFVKGIPTQKGYRYVVMTPRDNPRRKSNPKNPVVFDPGLGMFSAWRRTKGGTVYGTGHTKKAALHDLRDRLRRHRKGEPLSSGRGYFPENPMDLVVMGANPLRGNPRQIFLAPGETVTLHAGSRRGNPIVNPSGEICGKLVQGYPCTREPGHAGPHLPQGATLRPASRHNWGGGARRRNPDAAEMRESFVGRAAHRIDTYREPHMPEGEYAELFKLLCLYVKPLSGGQVLTIEGRGVHGVSDEKGRIWFVGGDQDVSEHLEQFGARLRSDDGQGASLYELGQAVRIDYKQRKEHAPHPEEDEWKHPFGEENGIKPTVYFDAKHKRLLLEGGDYRIESRGIVN